MKQKYETIHTRISPHSKKILEKFVKKDAGLFSYKSEVIEVALYLLDDVFESETFDSQITRTNAKQIFNMMNTDAKREVFRNFIKQCRVVDQYVD